MTAAQSIAAFWAENIYDYFVGGWADLRAARVMKMMYNVDGDMGYHGVPRMPVFVYKAVDDELSKVGANILYHRNTAGGHNEELVNGRPRAFAWLSSVLDGSYNDVYSTMGCTVVNVTSSIAPYVPWLNL